MVDELLRAFRDRGSAAPSAMATTTGPTPTPQVTLAAINPAPRAEAPPEPPPAAMPQAEEDAVEACGCFDIVRGQRTSRGFRVRMKDRFFSCQYIGFVRTGEESGWSSDLGKEVLYVIFHWGTLVVTGKGLVTLDDLLNDHRITRLSLGEGKHDVRIDDIRVLLKEISSVASNKRSRST